MVNISAWLFILSLVAYLYLSFCVSVSLFCIVKHSHISQTHKPLVTFLLHFHNSQSISKCFSSHFYYSLCYQNGICIWLCGILLSFNYIVLLSLKLAWLLNNFNMHHLPRQLWNKQSSRIHFYQISRYCESFSYYQVSKQFKKKQK